MGRRCRRCLGRWVGGQASDGEPRHRSGPRVSRVITHLDGWVVVHRERVRGVVEAVRHYHYSERDQTVETLRARSLLPSYTSGDTTRCKAGGGGGVR